jgi:hypothetical protein
MTKLPPYDKARSFPSFWPAFEPRPEGGRWYYRLKGLHRTAAEAVDMVARCADSSPALSAEVTALLGPVGWRENLVGAVATLAMEPRERPLDALWARIEGWSWVVPQLCATAALADARFDEKASGLLQRLVTSEAEPPPDPEDDPMAAALRHVVHGTSAYAPGLSKSGRAKTAAALAALVDSVADDRLRELLSYDIDRAGEIALRWRRLVVAAFQEAGRPLPSPVG